MMRAYTTTKSEITRGSTNSPKATKWGTTTSTRNQRIPCRSMCFAVCSCNIKCSPGFACLLAGFAWQLDLQCLCESEKVVMTQTFWRASFSIKWYCYWTLGHLDSTTISKTNKHMSDTFASDLACKKSTTKMMRGTRMWKRSHHSIAFM